MKKWKYLLIFKFLVGPYNQNPGPSTPYPGTYHFFELSFIHHVIAIVCYKNYHVLTHFLRFAANVVQVITVPQPQLGPQPISVTCMIHPIRKALPISIFCISLLIFLRSQMSITNFNQDRGRSWWQGINFGINTLHLGVNNCHISNQQKN